jgi:hypothetical protein
MESRTIWRSVAIGIVFVGIAAAIAAGAYNLGLTHGLAEGARALVEQPNGATGAVPPSALPAYAYGWGYGPHYWGHGFFFFPFFAILLLFLLLRFVFWHGHWHRGGHHRYDRHDNETDPGRGR